MSTFTQLKVARALDDARAAAQVLEGLQALREASVRSLLEAQLEESANTRDQEAGALRSAMDKLSSLRAQHAQLTRELDREPAQPFGPSVVTAYFRGLLLCAVLTLTCGAGSLLAVLVPCAAAGVATLLSLKRGVHGAA